MSKKLHVRKLIRKKLPYGKFTHVLSLNRSHWLEYRSIPNGGDIEDIRMFLRDSGQGDFRFICRNTRRGKVYTHLMLNHAMDVAMVKLIHQDKIHKIYEVILSDQHV